MGILLRASGLSLMKNLLHLIIILSCIGLLSFSKTTNDDFSLELRIPSFTAEHANMYMCHGIKINYFEPLYITKFVAIDETHNAHHILLYGCEEPGYPLQDSENIWPCGEMAKSDEIHYPICKKSPKIIYAWANMAPELNLPPNTGFKIGPGTRVNSLVMQVHYLKPSKSEDNSGIRMQLTDKFLPQEAGIYLLLTGGFILPHSYESMEAACSIDLDVKIHPFAFRAHTHKYGYLVSGYVVKNGQWIKLGEISPQLEQMFYPVENQVTIEKNDILAARCLMNNTSPNIVFIGPTDDDEMCNFYLMYYFQVDRYKPNQESLLGQQQCFTPGPPYWSWNSSKSFTDSHNYYSSYQTNNYNNDNLLINEIEED